jgi:uncharacterized phage protein gp47/JayE
MIVIPTTSQLYNSILNDLETEMGSNIPLFGKNFLRILAGVQAAKLKLYYVAIGKLQKNLAPDTADSEQSGGTLQRYGRIKLGRDPFPAQAGQYTVTVTGVIGATIPSQTTFKSNDDSLNPGVLYILDNAYVLAAVTDSITVRCLTAGGDGRQLVGDMLTATAPIANVNSVVEISTETVTPTDAESIEDYRQKIIQSYQLEPNGGSASDYRIWADDAPGVERVFPYARTGFTGEVNLYVEATPEDSTDGFGTPPASMLEAVEDVVELDPDTTKPINDRGRRPIQVIVNFLPVTIKTVDVEINDADAFSADEKTAIFNMINERVNTTRPFVAGADVLIQKKDIINVNLVISDILNVKPGAVFGDVVLKIDGVSVSTFQFLNGDIGHLNTVTYP